MKITFKKSLMDKLVVYSQLNNQSPANSVVDAVEFLLETTLEGSQRSESKSKGCTSKD